MTRLLLATCAALPDLTADDRLLAAALERRGAVVAPADWRDGAVDWDAADLVVIRSPWDYAEHVDEFLVWLRRVERLLHPARLVRWNAHKRYLLELEAAGVPIVPTELVERATAPDLEQTMRRRGWADAVVKPAVGGSSRATVQVGRVGLAAARKHLRALVEAEDALLQEFLPAVLTDGEVSLIFLGGRFSHAVRKRAAPGDWRVQSDFGGTVEGVEPQPAALRVAEQAHEAIPGRPVFARVDLLGGDGRPLVLECELIDPELFLGIGGGAADELAALILSG